MTVLIPSLKSPIVKQLLKRLGFDDDRIRIYDPGHKYTASSLLLVCDAPGIHPMLFQRARALLRVPTPKEPVSKAVLLRRRTSTKHVRRLLNAEAVVAHCDRASWFNSTPPSLDETIALFHDAAWIVGVHGAGMYNMIFAPQASIIEIMPYGPIRQHGYAIFWQLTNALGMPAYVRMYVKAQGNADVAPSDTQIRALSKFLAPVIQTKKVIDGRLGRRPEPSSGGQRTSKWIECAVPRPRLGNALRFAVACATYAMVAGRALAFDFGNDMLRSTLPFRFEVPKHAPQSLHRRRIRWGNPQDRNYMACASQDDAVLLMNGVFNFIPFTLSNPILHERAVEFWGEADPSHAVMRRIFHPSEAITFEMDAIRRKWSTQNCVGIHLRNGDDISGDADWVSNRELDAMIAVASAQKPLGTWFVASDSDHVATQNAPSDKSHDRDGVNNSRRTSAIDYRCRRRTTAVGVMRHPSAVALVNIWRSGVGMGNASAWLV